MSKKMQTEFDQNFKELFNRIINKALQLQEETEQPFFTNDYPHLEDGFIDTFNELLKADAETDWLSISPDHINITNGNTIQIDSDGFPFVKSSLLIKDLALEIKFIVYHHSKWDFYLTK